jgi:acetyl esterase/lipase
MSPVRPPFAAEFEEVLAARAVENPTSYDPEELAARREALRCSWPSIQELLEELDVDHSEVRAPSTGEHDDLAFSVLRPRVKPSHGDCMFSIHGGGLTRGDRFTWSSMVPRWVAQFGLTIFSVEYRLAPEFPYPASVMDCYRGLLWISENSESLEIDPNRIVLHGASAGGGLAAATALLVRDRGGPRLLGQMLKSPMLDDRNTTLSSQQFTGVPGWNRECNGWAWRAQLGDAAGGSGVSPYAAPARATELSNLPPAFIDVGSAEVFRDEAVNYATGIWRDGGMAELHVWPGGFHGFEEHAPRSLLARASRQSSDRWLERMLGNGVQSVQTKGASIDQKGSRMTSAPEGDVNRAR